MFIGREQELQLLHQNFSTAVAKMIVIRGRRRVGKSTLVSEFAKMNSIHFIKIDGLPPAPHQSNQDQLNYFSKQLHRQTNWAPISLTNWPDAFTALDSQLDGNKTLILLDEISWMAAHDKNFSGYLKGAWDNEIKKRKNIVLVLCGSVSSWIEENILGNTAFVGRLHQVIDLKELPLSACSQFWKNKKEISSFEKFKFLCVTGGIPRYLEELNPKETSDSNLHRLAFQSSGILYLEFDDIINETMNLENLLYRKVLLLLVDGPKSFVTLCSLLKIEKNGKISKLLGHLELAGFISRDYNIKPDGKLSKLSRYRLSDNYTRFYLKYLLPYRQQISKGIFDYTSLDQLSNWPIVMGLQFQNLLNANIKLILEKLKIPLSTVVFAGPFFQTKTRLTSYAVEIDLLILTKSYNYYLCEMKFRKKINSHVVDEVREKIKKFHRPKSTTVHPVLIYEGELSDAVVDSDFFSQILWAGELLKGSK